MTDSERHRLSLIIATLGPSTDNEKELITMLMAGIARQWTDGVDKHEYFTVTERIWLGRGLTHSENNQRKETCQHQSTWILMDLTWTAI